MQLPVIRCLQSDEMDFVMDLAAAEGWNPGLSDGMSFHLSDPDGFFVLEREGTAAGCISAVAYDDDYGFIGLYIVRPEFRGQGLGILLWRHAMQYLGSRNIGLDGVVAQQANYKKSGFVFAYNNIRYRFLYEGGFENAPGVYDLHELPFDGVVAFDRRCFPAFRTRFLDAWIRQPGHIALGYSSDDGLSGYIVVRTCAQGYKIGPLFANEERVADALFRSAVATLPAGAEIYLDVPQSNARAMQLADRYGMDPVFETARMYNRNTPDIDINAVFGVTTFELG